MFDVLNRLKNIEVGHFTRRRKLPHSTLLCAKIYVLTIHVLFELCDIIMHLILCQAVKAYNETQQATPLRQRSITLTTMETMHHKCQ